MTAAASHAMRFTLFKRETKDDPLFGLLSKKRRAWTGTLRTPLFPEIDLPISIGASDEHEFSVCRGHLERVAANCDSIRSQIACEALKTYQMYREAEGDAVPYADIHSQDRIWPLLKPREWRFEPGGHEFKSRVIIDFGWPNDHGLTAYLTDTELYQLAVEG